MGLLIEPIIKVFVFDSRNIVIKVIPHAKNNKDSYKLLKGILSSKPKFLTWLPLSHSYEHTVQFVQITVGAEIYYAESIEKLIKNMSECSPDIMTASFLPPILTPIVTLVFPGLVFALFFVLVEQEEVA